MRQWKDIGNGEGEQEPKGPGRQDGVVEALEASWKAGEGDGRRGGRKPDPAVLGAAGGQASAEGEEGAADSSCLDTWWLSGVGSQGQSTGTEVGCLVGDSSPKFAALDGPIPGGVRQAVRRSAGWKRQAQAVAEALRPIDPARSRVVEACSSWVVWRQWLETGRVSLADCDWCQQTRLCQACGHFGALRLGRAYHLRAMRLIAGNPVVPLLITVTLKNGLELPERLGHLLGSLGKLRQAIRNGRRGQRVWEFAKLWAVVWRVEIKRGSGSGEWHVHAHGLALRPHSRMLDLPKLRDEWHQITGDSFNVDVKLLASGRALTRREGLEAVEAALRKDCLEVFKYSTDFSKVSPAETVQAWQATFGKRLTRAWGGFYGLPEEAAPGPELVDELGEYRDWRFAWAEGEYSFRGLSGGKQPVQRPASVIGKLS